MHLLQSGVDPAVIALWRGHESVETTHGYVEAGPLDDGKRGGQTGSIRYCSWALQARRRPLGVPLDLVIMESPLKRNRIWASRFSPRGP